ncbi:MAG: acyltransferase [Nocardioidaceae bacterium]
MADPEPPRFPHLEGLRAVAALLVVVSHVGFWTGSSLRGPLGGLGARGDVGVAVFFAVSGFLLGYPRIGNRVPTGPYLGRRAVRILPAYLLALAVVVAACLGSGRPVGAGQVVAHLLVLQGLTGDLFQSFSQTWSLTTELSFYLLLPLVTRGLSLVRARRALALLGLAALAGLVATAASAAGSGPVARAVGLSVVGHAAWFAVGLGVAVALAVEPARPPAWWRLLRTSPDTLTAAACVLLVLAATGAAGPRGLSPSSPGAALVKEVLYAGIAGSLLLACVSSSPERGMLTRVLDSAPLREAGRISYGIFLWHVLVLQQLFDHTGLSVFRAPFWPVLLVVLVGSAVVAAASYRWLERPLGRTLRHRQEPRPQQEQHPEQDRELAGPGSPVPVLEDAARDQQHATDRHGHPGGD